MQFHVITLFPEVIEHYCRASIIGRAQNSGLVKINCINPRDFVTSNYKKVDDTPYGGGPGMVMLIEPIMMAYESIPNLPKDHSVLVMAASGQTFNQPLAQELSLTAKTIVLICGHYEGIDHRLFQAIPHATPICVGETVLTGGELPALMIIDGVSRLIEGVLGENASLEEESFNQNLLEYPHYTRPQNYRGLEVPEVLLSGNHQAIAQWRKDQQLLITQKYRPEWVK